MSNPDTWQQQVAGQLRQLAAEQAGPSKAARFRALFPDIEDAMRRGCSQRELIATLAGSGLTMTLDELRNALYRERKRRKARPPDAAIHPPPRLAPPPATPAAPPGSFDWQRHRDKKPNW